MSSGCRNGVYGGAGRPIFRLAGRSASAVLILALASWCGPPLASAAKPGKAKRPAKQTAAPSAQPISDEDLLRWMPDDCSAIGLVNVPAILKSKAVRQGKLDPEEMSADFREQGEMTGLEFDQIEWMAFGAPTECLLSQAGAKPSLVAVVRSKEALRPVKDLPGASSTWKRQAVGKKAVYVKEGIEPEALCVVDDHTLLMGFPDSLRAVLKRNGPAKLPDRLDRARRMLDRSKAMSIAVVLPQKYDDVDLSSLLISREILTKIDAVLVEADLGDDLRLSLAAACRDEATALQIKGIGVALWSIIEAQGLGAQEPETQEVLKSVRISQNGPVVALHVTMPAKMLKDAKATCTPSSESTAPAVVAPSSLTPIYSYVPSAPTPPMTEARPLAPYTPPATPPYSCPLPPPRPLLDLSDVARLVEAGVDDAVIQRYVGARSLASPLSADDLIFLSKKKASSPLIQAIQGLPVEPPQESPTPKEGGSTSSPRPAQGYGAILPTADPNRPAMCSQVVPAPGGNSSVPPGPQQELLYTSEQLQQMLGEWERFWLMDQPQRASPFRSHGGVL